MSRKIAREIAYKLIFEYLFTKEKDEENLQLLESGQDLSALDFEYIKNVFDGVTDKYDELCEMLSKHTKNFTFDRIFRPDLAGLLLATYEMKYMQDIPLKVSISEILDIVKSYSTEKSNIFVNGVLKGVYNDLVENQEEGKE